MKDFVRICKFRIINVTVVVIVKSRLRKIHFNANYTFGEASWQQASVKFEFSHKGKTLENVGKKSILRKFLEPI